MACSGWGGGAEMATAYVRFFDLGNSPDTNPKDPVPFPSRRTRPAWLAPAGAAASRGFPLIVAVLLKVTFVYTI